LSFNFLFRGESKNKSILFLSFFYLIYSLYALQTYVIESNLINKFRWFYVWPLPIYSIISLPTYFYFRSTFNNDFKWKWKYIILFIPFVLSVIDVVLVYSKPSYVYQDIVDMAIEHSAKRFNAEYGLLNLNQHYVLRHIWQFLSLVALFPMLLKFIRSNRSQEKHKLVQNQWLIILYALLCLMSIITSIYGIERLYFIQIIPFLQDNAAIIQFLFYFILFLIAVIPISFPSVLYETLANYNESKTIKKEKTKNKGNHLPLKPKYGLNTQEIKNKLEAIEKKEFFLNSDFDLNHCAQLLEIPTHHLSYFLKHNLDLSFSSYRNNLRIKKAKCLITQDYLNSHTIEGLAIICGFANRSSFSKAFKKEASVSPSEYFNSLKVDNY
jgi:AraC-like DNA-binding protein